MKRVGCIFWLAGLIFLLSVSCAFGWGSDVQIYDGKINTFDVDYNLDNGDMFVAFQPQGATNIEVYKSTDHGLTWQKIKSFLAGGFAGTTARTDLRRIKVLWHQDRLHVFWVDSKGFLDHSRCSASGGGYGAVIVSRGPIDESSFDVMVDPQSGRMIAVFRDERYSDHGLSARRSDDNGSNWTDDVNFFERESYNELGESARMSAVYGPAAAGGKIHVAYGLKEGAPADEIWYARFPTAGNMWQTREKRVKITANSFFDYDPRVVAANVNDSGVWILYNRNRGNHEIDLMSAYSPDGGNTWTEREHPVAAADDIDEYIADVEFYKESGNHYIDMVYIRDDPDADPVRQGVWVYTTTSDHNNWRGEVVFNDQDLQSWPEDTAPRIVYSPGAAKPGGGVVFSYAGANGLYFDAPWIVSLVPGPIIPPLKLTRTLTVTVHGSGAVVSSPAGMDCRTDAISGDKTCTATFAVGTAVALTATPVDGDSYTSHFIGWSGGGCAGDGACAVTMNADVSLEASFGALGIPVFAVNLPAGQEAWTYLPVATPVKQPEAANCRPFAVGDLSTGNFNLQVGLPPFAGAVDVYLGIQSDALAGGAFFLVDSGGSMQAYTPAMTTLPAWKSNVSYTDIDESLWGSISLSLLPPGTYNLYLAVTPTGETDFAHYYLWGTYFVVH